MKRKDVIVKLQNEVMVLIVVWI